MQNGRTILIQIQHKIFIVCCDKIITKQPLYVEWNGMRNVKRFKIFDCFFLSFAVQHSIMMCDSVIYHFINGLELY